MKRYYPISLIMVLTVFLACLPKAPLFLNKQHNKSKVDLVNNGVIAFIPTQYDGVDIQLDVRNIELNQVFRIRLTPDLTNSINFNLGPIKLAQKKLDKDLKNRTVIAYQLPPGHYQPIYMYSFKGRSQGGSKIKSNQFTIEKGKVTSLGTLYIDTKLNFHTILRTIFTKSDIKDISAELKEFKAYGINDFEIITASIKVAN